MNSFDCSLEDDFSLYIPGPWIVGQMGLSWNGKDGRFFDKAGHLVAFDPSAVDAGPSALLVRKDHFCRFLRKKGYDIIWTLLGAKQIIGGMRQNWEGELQINGVFKMKGDAIRGKIRNRFINP
jgi:hypothetical protein